MSTAVRKQIDAITVKLSERFKRDRDKQILTLLRKNFGIETLSIGESTVEVNTLKVKNIVVDEYNNLYCRFVTPMKWLKDLVALRHIIVCMFEKQCYRGRAGRNIFICYFQQYEHKLNQAQVQWLINEDEKFETDRREMTFFQWLQQELNYDGHKFTPQQFYSKKG